MTSKRTLENDVADATDAVLGDLDAAARLKLSMEAQARGDHESVEALKETTPRYTLDAPDPDYRASVRDSLTFALTAWVDLTEAMWRFMYKRLDGRHDELLAQQFDVSDWDHIEEPSPENEYGELPAMEAAAHYYAEYHGWREFVEEVYDVPLATFLRVPFPERNLSVLTGIAGLVDGTGMDAAPPEDPPEEIREEIKAAAEATPEVEFGGWARGVTIDYHGAERTPGEAAAVKARELADAYTEGSIRGRERSPGETVPGGASGT
jgi:hypothetical protein